MTSSPENSSVKKIELREFPYGEWIVRTSKSHIMTKEQEEAISSQMSLPHLPDMVFSQNGLSLQHKESGFGIRFNPIDALKTVNPSEDLVRVAMSKEWLDARSDHAHINKIAKPYDWTYSPTNYRGTLTRGDDTEDQPGFDLSITEEKIDYERLKIQEKILFYDEIVLYEDELDDNGISKLSIKIRVMPSGFFILQRFFLRVDNTLVRAIDTRLYHDFTKKYLLREYSERQSKADDLNVPTAMLTNENEIVQHLTLLKEVTEKLSIPNK